MPNILDIIDEVKERVSDKIDQYSKDMNDAYYGTEGDLSVGVSIKFKPSTESGNAIDAEIGIRFKVEEVNDKNKFSFFGNKNDAVTEFIDKQAEKRREIIFRDFKKFAATLRISGSNSVTMKRFSLVA